MPIWSSGCSPPKRRLPPREKNRKRWKTSRNAFRPVVWKSPNCKKPLKSKSAKSRKKSPSAPGRTEEPALGEARLTLLRIRLQAVEAEQQAYEKEILAHDSRGELALAMRDQAARRTAQAEKSAAALRKVVAERRQAEAQETTETARRAALQAHPAFAGLLAENQQLAEARSGPDGLVAKIDKLARQSETIRARLLAVSSEHETAIAKAEAGGLTDVVGYYLRTKRAELPNPARLRRNVSARKAEIRATQLTYLQLVDRRAALADQFEERVQAALANAGPMSESELEETGALVREHLRTQRTYLDALIKDTSAYLAKLVEVDGYERQLASETEEFRAFINRVILWIRNAPAIGLGDAESLVAAAKWLVDAGRWIDTIDSALNHAAEIPHIAAMLTLAILILLAIDLRSGRRFASLAEQAHRKTGHAYWATLAAFALTIESALLAPFVLGVLGWLIASPADAPDLAKAAGAARWSVCPFVFFLLLARRVCRRDGLAEAHFEWPAPALKAIRKESRILLLAGTPILFVFSAIEAQAHEAWKFSLGRLSLMLGLALLAWRAGRLLAALRKAFAFRFMEQGELWIGKLMSVFQILAIAAPAALIGMAAIGYSYTAMRLSVQMLIAMAFFMALALLFETISRWVSMTRRELALRQARLRVAARMAAREGEEGEAPPAAIEEEADLALLDRQTRGTIKTVFLLVSIAGLWWILFDILPAFGLIAEVELWPTTRWIEERMAGPGGAEISRAVEVSAYVDMGDLLFALAVFAFAFLAARNVPGLIEMALLQKLRLESGSRFAIGSVIRYSIVIAGILIGFNALGFSWSKVQWLVAAMSVGLGFGLQEFFANFVSGAIILFERPVRVGDIVTVGDISGRVTRINLRATTILDWDRKELIVPNKEFITGRVVNWTLTDQTARIVLPIGVAYGSNIARALELLLQCARSHPLVLQDPEPSAFFVEFGSSSLNLKLFCFLPNRDNYMKVVTELHLAIEKAFQEAGIAISYPQLDVHLDMKRGERRAESGRQKAEG